MQAAADQSRLKPFPPRFPPAGLGQCYLMRSRLLRLSAYLTRTFFLSLLGLVWTVVPVMAHDPIVEMTETAQRILAILNEEQKSQAVFEFADPQRQTWNFVPDKFIQPGGKRLGLSIADMSVQQRLLTHALLNAALSNEGYRQAVTIMTLEQVLHELEENNPIRNPQKYYLSIFGTPSESGRWGWRFEGHHLSLNLTIVDGKMVAMTPSFFGTNPAEVREGPMKGLKVLAAEESLARDFVASLNDEQKQKAIVPGEAPADIVTGTAIKVDETALTPASGIPFEALNPEQQKQLLKIVGEYANAFETPLVSQLQQRQALSGTGMTFAWMGATEPGKGHYYRIQTPEYLFEYDNTQNDANHVHIVWRQFDGDFGEDLLKAHYDAAHQE